MPECRWRFVELGHFDKDFVKNTRKRKEILPKDEYNQGLSFKNQDTFFDFQKGHARPLLSSLPLVARL